MKRQIVINVPESILDAIQSEKTINDVQLAVLQICIRNGILLPIGHGKLFDVNDLLDRIGLEDNESNRDENVGEIVTLEDFDYIPTIIPADTESEGEQ